MAVVAQLDFSAHCIIVILTYLLNIGDEVSIELLFAWAYIILILKIINYTLTNYTDNCLSNAMHGIGGQM